VPEEEKCQEEGQAIEELVLNFEIKNEKKPRLKTWLLKLLVC
jgi:hypothetical protein